MNRRQWQTAAAFAGEVLAVLFLFAWIYIFLWLGVAAGF